MGLVAAGVGDDGPAELPEQLGDGDGDEPEDAGAAVEGAPAGGGDGDGDGEEGVGEEGVGEQADRGPAVPGCPGGDLAAVQPADLLRLLVIFLNGPGQVGHHGQQHGQRLGSPRFPHGRLPGLHYGRKTARRARPEGGQTQPPAPLAS